jgi:hypothetical protein|tara:strand:+ start:442 stop:756 length:315 start_codon:yes stop_codon:yes gene_type:complete
MNNIDKLIKAIRKINPDAEMCIRGDDIDTCTIEWSNTSPISKEDIKAKMSEVQSEYDAKQYQRDREAEYPSWQDQMDLQYWDKINNTSTWQDAVQAVKDKYPKS